MHRLGLIICVVLIASCAEPTASDPVNDLDAIRVGIRVTPTTIVAGQAASMSLTLKNTKPYPVEISDCPIYFTVEDQAGTVVGGSNAIFCAAFLSALVYQPLRFHGFESKTMTFEWPAGETQNIPAGVYNAFGWVNDLGHVSPAAQIRVLSSN